MLTIATIATIATIVTVAILDAMESDKDASPFDPASGVTVQPQYFDVDGNPVSLREYARLRRDTSRRLLARERVGDVLANHAQAR